MCAKIAEFKRLNKEDYPDAPDYFTRLIEAYNISMENIYNAVNKNNLNFTDNINSERQLITLKHEVPQKVSLKRIKSKVIGVMHLANSINDQVYQPTFTNIGEQMIQVTVSFKTAPTKDVNVDLLFIGQ